ncbi:hypothetical protein WMW72_34125 [Paenibacillus filicis]|uniref:Uncharacterized protein n=1 Tax=Paenibacillus filicis TaxID=669464 RepID=A0ABU9DVV3_9BACL
MKLSNHESALISYIRTLCFEDLLDAFDGLMFKAGKASKDAEKVLGAGDHLNHSGFLERSQRLENLANLLGIANDDYRDHIFPELNEPQKKQGVTLMTPSDPGEIIHLFEVIKKYNVQCSLELQSKDSVDPLVSIVGAQVDTEYIERPGGPDAVWVKLDDSELTFDLGLHSFSKHISDCQIDICIASEENAAWFNSGIIPDEGIVKANDYESHSYQEKYLVIELNDAPKASATSQKIEEYCHNGFSISEFDYDPQGFVTVTLSRAGEEV